VCVCVCVCVYVCGWKSRMVFTMYNMYTCNINKHEVLCHGAKCSIISYSNSTGWYTPLRPYKNFSCVRIRTRLRTRLLTSQPSNKGMKAGIICIEWYRLRQWPASDSDSTQKLSQLCFIILHHVLANMAILGDSTKYINEMWPGLHMRTSNWIAYYITFI
jgi:hypothetical protein